MCFISHKNVLWRFRNDLAELSGLIRCQAFVRKLDVGPSLKLVVDGAEIVQGHLADRNGPVSLVHAQDFLIVFLSLLLCSAGWLTVLNDFLLWCVFIIKEFVIVLYEKLRVHGRLREIFQPIEAQQRVSLLLEKLL